MKDLYMTLPPFAPDYGGACEVLYELGGLVLICDASGCTVNYVSYDEPRWHTRPGNVFCSGLTEIDAVMGNDEALIEKALRAAEILHPNFIAYIGSSVPMIVGTDFPGIARETEERSGIASFGFDCNGIRSYIEGAGRVMEALVTRFSSEKTEDSGTILLGLLPLDDADLSASEKVYGLFQDVRLSLSYHCAFEDLKTVQNGKESLVLSRAGLPAARYLEETYGIPYSVGFPFQKCSRAHKKTLVIGEDVRAASLSRALGNADALDLFSKDGLADFHTADEDEIKKIVADYDNVIADPVFRPLVRGNFVPMPTVSVSGGIYKEAVSMLDTEGIARLLV